MTKRPKTVPEAKSLMWEVHQRMPAWKADKLLELQKADQVDLAAVGEATGILFESKEMLDEAVLYLDKIRKGKVEKEDANEGVSKTSDPHSSQSKDQDMSDGKGSDDLKEKKTTSASAENAQSKDAKNEDAQQSSKKPGDTNRQQDANASSTDPATQKEEGICVRIT